MDAPHPATKWPWWFPGALLRVYALVALGFIGHLVRLSRDPWTHAWRMPGRSLGLLLVQAFPLVFFYLVLWVLLGRWIAHSRYRLLARWLLASALMAFCVLDGTYAAYTDRHLLEAGQLSFLFQEGAFWASGVLSLRLVAGTIAVLAGIAWFLVTRIADLPRPVPWRAAVGSALIVLAIDLVALLTTSGARRDLYAYSIGANPIHSLPAYARRLAIGARGGVRTEIPGLVPLREVMRPGRPPLPAKAFVEPRLILVILLDGFRADYLTSERAPSLSALAEAGGIALNRYYTSYPGTDRSVYSLLYSRHPFFADQTFKMGTKPVPRWIGFLRNRGYKTEVFQSNPDIYRFLPLVYESFDRVQHGTANIDPLASDAALIQSLDARIRQLGPGERLFAFVLLHSTHYPYKGERLGSPTQNYAAAVRYLDQQVAGFVTGLRQRNESFLALIGGDHGTLLGECGKAGYSTMHSNTLHTAMVAFASPDASPALGRFSAIKDLMLQPQSLLGLVLDPRFDLPQLSRPEMQWNVAVPAGVSSLDSPLTLHDVAGNAMTVEPGRNTATWRCGELDACAEYGTDVCDSNRLRHAGARLLVFEGRQADLALRGK